MGHKLIPIACLALLVSTVFATYVRAQSDSGLPAPSARVGLASIWQKEVIDGKVSEAAEEYSQLYSRGTMPTGKGVRRDSSPTQVERLRAAYRAGRCFDALDNPARATRAYRWVVREFERFAKRASDPNTPRRDAVPSLRVLRDRAVVSLRKIDEDGGTPAFGVELVPEFVNALRESSVKDAQVLERIRQEVLERRRFVGVTRDLLASLSRRGVRLRLSFDLVPRSADFSLSSSYSFSRGAAALEAMLEAVTSNDWEPASKMQLRASLKDRFWLRALASASEGRLDEARRAATTVALLDPEFERAKDFLDTLDEGRQSEDLTDDVSREAERYHRELRSETRRAARGFLAQAERWEKRDRALRMIERSHRALLRAAGRGDSGDFDDPELASLLSVTRLRAIERAGRDSDADVEDLFDDDAERARQTIDLSSELVDLFVEEWTVDGGGVKVAPTASSEPDGSAVPVLREYRQIVAAAEQLRGAKKRLGLELARFRVSRLRSWFPRLRGALSEIPPLESSPSGARDR
jgi:hypothetical protein